MFSVTGKMDKVIKFKSIAGVVLAACSGVTTAQRSVTLYGIADAGMVREAGGTAGSVTRPSSGVASASRLGFRGSEHLGGGITAIFTLESGLRVDTGERDNAATLCGLAADGAGCVQRLASCMCSTPAIMVSTDSRTFSSSLETASNCSFNRSSGPRSPGSKRSISALTLRAGAMRLNTSMVGCDAPPS